MFFSAFCVLTTLILIAQPTLSMHFGESRNGRFMNSLHNNNNSKTQIVIFDPQTGREINPLLYLPVNVGNKRKPMQPTGNFIELPYLWNPCSCTDYSCVCCLGVRIASIFNHKVCVAITYNTDRFEIELRIIHNQRILFNIGFSAQNPPTFCAPILLPIPVNSCLRTYNIRSFQRGNIQICLSFVLKLFQNEIFELKFNCLRFGANGVHFVKPLQTEFDEDSIELNGGGGGGTPAGGGGGGGGGVGGNVDYTNGIPKREQIILEENYSGISMEQPFEENNFIRRGRVRNRKGVFV